MRAETLSRTWVIRSRTRSGGAGATVVQRLERCEGARTETEGGSSEGGRAEIGGGGGGKRVIARRDRDESGERDLGTGDADLRVAHGTVRGRDGRSGTEWREE